MKIFLAFALGLTVAAAQANDRALDFNVAGIYGSGAKKIDRRKPLKIVARKQAPPKIQFKILPLRGVQTQNAEENIVYIGTSADAHRGYGSPKVKDGEPYDDIEISDYVMVRLYVARMKALAAIKRA